MDHILNLTLLSILLLLVQNCVGPPAKTKENKEPTKNEEEKPASIDELGLEYNRYLKEVVDALESDPEFRKKLETAEEADFRNGKVAAELEYVNHHVRTKLDELKRTELQRLRELVHQAEEIEKNEVDPNHVNPGHIDHTNPHTFEQADLHKLITQVRKDLAEADRKRREEFKEYELQKKFEQEQKIKAMDEEHRKQFLHELEEQKKKHQQHEPLHHPGSRAQLEEVWEKQDHMENQKFNPKTFFLLHDINGDGYWDEDEVKTLFLKELDKLYQAGVPEDDMREREEEMERMREHVFKESDTNGDRLISYDEFLEQTKKQEFNKDEGWESIDSQPQFTQQEYEEFERRRQLEIQRLIDQGLLQPYAPGMMPPPPHGYEQHPGQYQQQFHHPGAVPSNQVPHYPNVAHHPQGVPPQVQYPAHGQPGGHQYQAQQYQIPQQPNQLPQHPNQASLPSNQIPQGQPVPPQQNQAAQNVLPPSHAQNVLPQSQNIGQNSNHIPQNLNQVPQGQYQQAPPVQYQQAQQKQYQPPQYHLDPNQIVPNTNQHIPSYQQASNQIPSQQASPNLQASPNQQPSPNQQLSPNQQPSAGQHSPPNQMPNHQSNQIPNNQPLPSNHIPQKPNQVPQGQVAQPPNTGNYGSISMQQGATYQQNQLHSELNKAHGKEIPTKQ